MRVLTLFATAALVFFTACKRDSSESDPAAAVAQESKAAASGTAADFLFTNAAVYTVASDRSWADAVAVKDNRIVYVGDATGSESFKGAETDVRDLQGGMVLPGFVSGHDHLVSSSWTNKGVNLVGSASPEEALQRVRDWAEQHPDEPFIVGFGWDRLMFGGELPTAKMLDSATGDRPAILIESTVHDAWFNSKALAAAGVDRDTPDKKPGYSYWVRDEEGNPTGVGIEVVWFDAYVDAGAWDANRMIPESMEILHGVAAERGWTSFIGQGVVTPNLTNLEGIVKDTETTLSLLREQEQEGTIRLRSFLNLIYKDAEGSPEFLVDSVSNLREEYDTDLVRAQGVKIHPEGTWNGKTALMLKPYEGTDTHGSLGMAPELIADVVLRTNEAGFDVAIHVDGSATARYGLDAFEASQNAGYTSARNSLQHYSWITPEDQQRTADLGITVNVTPIWATNWANQADAAFDAMGEERVQTMFQPIRKALDNGLRGSISPDIPSTSIPYSGALMQLEAAVALTNPDDPDDQPKMHPEFALTLEQGIEALTIHPAWQARMEDKIGTIEVGKYADLVFLEKNLFEVPPREISEVKILGTMMDGRFTHGGDF